MRAQYFRDITKHGIEEALQMAFLVEQGNDAVHSESYRTVREALTENSKMKQPRCLQRPGWSVRPIAAIRRVAVVEPPQNQN